MNSENYTFITGASGFIGHKLMQSLINDENQRWGKIRVLSRKPLPGVETVICDLHSEKIVQEDLQGVETIFHLAAFAKDIQSESNEEHNYKVVNVDSTVHLVKLAITCSVKKFIFVSSVKAGGGSEDQDFTPDGIYGKTKREAELAILELGKNSNMHISIVRPALVYGSKLSGNLDLMRRLINQGLFPPLPEVGNRRSMVHVDDVVRALLFVADDKRANGEIFIATDGVHYSSREVYEALCHMTGRNPANWSVPKIIFDLIGNLSTKLRFTFEKLLGDDLYSSKKLESLGFSPKKTLESLSIRENFFK